MEWSLFRTAMISSAVESCELKLLRMARGCEKKTPWSNQDVKTAIRAKMRLKPCYKTGYYLICNPGIQKREKLQLRK